MADRRWLAAGALGVLGGVLLLAPAVSAASWWTPVRAAPAGLTQVASNSTSPTLAIVNGSAGWLWVSTGRYRPAGISRAAAVAASGSSGLVLRTDGQLMKVQLGARPELLQTLPGRAVGLVIGAGPVAVVATSRGLFEGRLNGGLRPVALDGEPPLALAGAVAPRRALAVATESGVYFLQPGARPILSPGSPRLGSGAFLAELGDGVVLATSGSGLVWGLYRDGWQPAFQLLPEGGLGGVPRITALAAVSGSAAYLATAGFGTLLTPDGGYSWYRAAPAGPAPVLALATSGPVMARRPSGNVLAVTTAGLFLHRLRALPAPPVYAGRRGLGELAGTAVVTILAAALVVALMFAWRRHRGRGVFV
ncbi:MAG: hypothetical protein WBU92_10945 [Candidatus Dormiibacterota bacterium]